MMNAAYTGRFAPSPTGPLHAGSLVAALASWLDARAHGGRWLVRIEDIDQPRCPPGNGEYILQQLHALHLRADEVPQWQSQRYAGYERAVAQLQQAGLAYPCGCTRKDIDAAYERLGYTHARHGERPYPGTCRDGLHGKPASAWRFYTELYWHRLQAQFQAKSAATAQQSRGSHPFLIADKHLHWHDRILGAQQQDVVTTVGDFALRRTDGLWVYQLAVVVDDADQGITHVLRGADLLSSTPRQLYLYRLLGYDAPSFSHVPLLVDEKGVRLSKRHGALAVAALRERGVRAEKIIGLLAWLAGLLPSLEAAKPQELVGLFGLEKIPRQDIIVSETAWRFLS